MDLPTLYTGTPRSPIAMHQLYESAVCAALVQSGVLFEKTDAGIVYQDYGELFPILESIQKLRHWVSKVESDRIVEILTARCHVEYVECTPLVIQTHTGSCMVLRWQGPNYPLVQLYIAPGSLKVQVGSDWSMRVTLPLQSMTNACKNAHGLIELADTPYKSS